MENFSMNIYRRITSKIFNLPLRVFQINGIKINLTLQTEIHQLPIDSHLLFLI